MHHVVERADEVWRSEAHEEVRVLRLELFEDLARGLADGVRWYWVEGQRRRKSVHVQTLPGALRVETDTGDRHAPDPHGSRQERLHVGYHDVGARAHD